MQVHGFGWETVSVSPLAVTVEGPDGQIALHSEDADFAMRLAVALITAQGRRQEGVRGRCQINRTSEMWLEGKHV